MIPEIIGIESNRPMVLAMNGSVGTNGKNFPDDVRLIQDLLNRVPPFQGGPAAPLAVDGRCGPLTIAAIRKFQAAKLHGFADGRVDAPGSTIQLLGQSTIEAGKVTPSPPGLVLATSTDVAAARSILDFPYSRLNSQPSTVLERTGAGSNIGTGSSSTGFGLPFTPSGWTIDNSVGAFDFTIEDKGVYAARMEIFQDNDPSVRQKLNILAAIATISKGPPVGADFSLPSFTSTKGRIIRGLSGFAPISAFSFMGVCGIAFVGGSVLNEGGSLTLFQFQWMPGGPPGTCLGFAFMAGKQMGIPSLAAGGGIGVCGFL